MNERKLAAELVRQQRGAASEERARQSLRAVIVVGFLALFAVGMVVLRVMIER